jgi:hypothetical protein
MPTRLRRLALSPLLSYQVLISPIAHGKEAISILSARGCCSAPSTKRWSVSYACERSRSEIAHFSARRLSSRARVLRVRRHDTAVCMSAAPSIDDLTVFPCSRKRGTVEAPPSVEMRCNYRLKIALPMHGGYVRACLINQACC